MDANFNRRITIDGRDWPVKKPTDGQLLGLSMIIKGGLSNEQAGGLLIKLILQLLLDDEAKEAFVSEFVAGGYGPEHLTAVAKELMAGVKETPSEEAVAEKPKRAPRKTAAKKTAPRKRAQ